MNQWCAVCGKKLAPIHETAYRQCCGGLGYWSPVAPEKNWPLRFDRVTKRYFYPGPKWNAKEIAKWRNP